MNARCKNGGIWYNHLIRTFARNIFTFLKRFSRTAFLWSLFFVLAPVALGGIFHRDYESYLVYKKPELFGAGGPESGLQSKTAVLLGSTVHSPNMNADIGGRKRVVLKSGGAVLGEALSLASVIPVRDGIRIYKVKKGDTLSAIAAQFGITVETITAANKLGSHLAVGQELVVLPVSGVLYTVADGDTLESVANRFEVKPELIHKYNSDYITAFEKAGNSVILPYARQEILKRYSAPKQTELPDLGWYFVLPAKGWNWGNLHDYNAVDIADSCGNPFFASAPGVIVEESSDGSWNDGYGNYILIEHMNGTKTRYAHTMKNLVGVGDLVKQGEKIGFIGNSGNTTSRGGGCHLHFEVIGAKNPFALE